MTTMYEVWGFGKIVAVGAGNGNDRIAQVQRALAAAARDRGLDPASPSDALDMSRDSIVDDALRMPWEIVDGTLYVAYDGFLLGTLIRDYADPFLS